MRWKAGESAFVGANVQAYARTEHYFGPCYVHRGGLMRNKKWHKPILKSFHISHVYSDSRTDRPEKERERERHKDGPGQIGRRGDRGGERGNGCTSNASNFPNFLRVLRKDVVMVEYRGIELAAPTAHVTFSLKKRPLLYMACARNVPANLAIIMNS